MSEGWKYTSGQTCFGGTTKNRPGPDEHGGAEVGQRYITRINELRGIKNFNGVYNIRSLRLHPLTGDMAGKLSIYLTGGWRLIVTKGDTEESLIIEEVSNHYGD